MFGAFIALVDEELFCLSCGDLLRYQTGKRQAVVSILENKSEQTKTNSSRLPE